MSKRHAARDDKSALMRRALTSLTEQELEFFPETDPMLDQSEESWIKSSDQHAQSKSRHGCAFPGSAGDSAHSGIL